MVLCILEESSVESKHYVLSYFSMLMQGAINLSLGTAQKAHAVVFQEMEKRKFYCVNTSYPMGNLLNWSAQTGPPNVRKRRPVFPPAGRSVVLCTPQMAPRTSFLSRQPDVIASFFVWRMYCADVFSTSPESLDNGGFFNLICKYFIAEMLYTYQAQIHLKKSAGNAPQSTYFHR